MLNGTLVRSFAHDAAGNLTAGLPLGASYAVSYNQRNRPAGLSLNGTPIASYLFNSEEQMASRTLSAPLSPAGTTHYIYDLSGHLIAEATGATAASAVIVREYIWLDHMPVMVVDDVNTATPIPYAAHADHLNRPIRLTDAARATVWSATWTPFGIAHAVTGTATQNLRFPGQYFLVEQGLAYNWHRFYDATTGRYTQPDPLGFVDGPGRFVYAGNSPEMEVDPEGRIAGVLVQGGTNLAKCLANPACRAAMQAGATATAAAAAAGLADAGDLIWSGCEWLYRKITGSGGGGGDDDDDECLEQYEDEIDYCRRRINETALPDMYSACMTRAMDRYAICLRNAKGGTQRSMPNRWSEKDEEVWRNFDK